MVLENNWYALLLSIVKRKSVDESLMAVGIKKVYRNDKKRLRMRRG